MSAVSDVDNIHKNANSPSTFDKLFNGSMSKLQWSLTQVKKLKNKEKNLKILIANYSLQAWDDLIKEEGRIRRSRRAVYAREKETDRYETIPS